MELRSHFERVRAFTMALAAPLSAEDAGVQSMPDASPTKWHLAHTSWFFERFVLAVFCPGYEARDAAYEFLFNSYYESVGDRHPRAERGLLSRPSLEEVIVYRHHVDEHVLRLIDRMGARADADRALVDVLVLGMHHEQQHQELLLTDIKHAFFANPIRPAYRKAPPTAFHRTVASYVDPSGPSWTSFSEGITETGHGGKGFAFDNESPEHRVYLQAFRLARRPTTNGEFLAFIEDGGYARPDLWLADGWAVARAAGWTAPLYWERADAARATVGFRRMTFFGMQPLDLDAPVSHISFYEADAYARWAGARLPTEHEWERVARGIAGQEGALRGNFVENGFLDPIPPSSQAPSSQEGGVVQLFGDVWEWTASPYVAYPGFMPLDGGLGEYNGKFMCNQLVLRGGSAITSGSHIRPSYRNFFPPSARWQMAGLRLARSE